MRWKLQKDKLRGDTTEDSPLSEAPATASDTLAADAAAQTSPEQPASGTGFAETADALPLGAPHAGDEGQTLPLGEPLHLDKPAFSAPPPHAGDDAALDPLNFAPLSDLDTAPVLIVDTLDSTSVFALGGPTMLTADGDAGQDDAPVFGQESVFAGDMDEGAPLFSPASSAFDPLPEDASDAFALPLSSPEPIVLGGDTDFDPLLITADTNLEPIALGGDAGLEPIVLGGDTQGTYGAFVPYQPPTGEPAEDSLAAMPPDADPYTDPDLEIGAMAFNPQSPLIGTFDPHAPTAGEEIAQETTDFAFADTQDTSPLAFEPAFEAPEALAGTVPLLGEDAGDEPFMDRDALAAGLVTMEASSGLPRVAPFVPAGQDAPDFGDDASHTHTLTLRLSGLSASYPLVKAVTTIGRPDRDTATYPDIEVDLDDGVSRRHAEVRLEGDSVYLVDMGSTNGTILNGELLAANQPAPLLRGDRIRIGERVEIVFE